MGAGCVRLDRTERITVLWTYRDEWVQITTQPSEISAIEQSAKDYIDSAVDEIGSYVAGTIDDDGNVIIMFDERMFTI